MSRQLLEEAMGRMYDVLEESNTKARYTHEDLHWKLSRMASGGGGATPDDSEEADSLAKEHEIHLEKIKNGKASGVNTELAKKSRKFISRVEEGAARRKAAAKLRR